ncbi:uncharacterized protein LOC123677686 [Harmonia axyridis]|uniref:uncharacterized protein LOC123677686 n=1 Tax=Harmonia axyridis TaxID=115357 RepID=UPI001E2777E8|nr:uncharacterized protein LOC123677686 [Harmonia axyridis]
MNNREYLKTVHLSLLSLRKRTHNLREMEGKIWETSDNGDIEIISLTEKYLNESLELLQNVFFTEEFTATACGVPNDPEAKKEWGEICLAVANEGVSVVAIDRKKDKVAAVAFNKLYQKINSKNSISLYDKCLKSFKNQSAKDLIMCCKQMDNTTDLFDKCGCNCYLELMFLATSPNYKGQRLATKLTNATIELTRQLHQGNNVKKSLNGTMLHNEPRPGAVVAVFTSNISQKLAEKLGFETAACIFYKDMMRNGKSYYELIDKKQEKILIVFKKL